MALSDEQQAVVDHGMKGHACVLAGPGTGKSLTVISYGAKLLESGTTGVRIVTFTRAATGELADKVLQAGHEQLSPSTIHSFAISLLLANPNAGGIPQPLRLLDDWEWQKLVRPLFARRLKLGNRWRLADTLKKEMQSNWESLVDTPSPIPEELRLRFKAEWDNQRRLFRYYMPSEILYRLLKGLETHDDLDLGGLQLLIVDEYQDLNACDLACLDVLVRRDVKVIAVGDDDQSIYSFRNAHPAGIREFPNKYGAALYPLTINRRCGEEILRWAEHVVKQDTGRSARPPLRVWHENPRGTARYLEFRGERAEARGVAGVVRWLQESEGLRLRDILILYRTKGLATLLAEELQKQNIQWSSPETVNELFESEPVRILTAALRLLTNRDDSLSWWALLLLGGGVGAGTIDKLLDASAASNAGLGKWLLDLQSQGRLKAEAGSRVATLVEQTTGLLTGITVPESGPWGKWISDLIAAGQFKDISETLGPILLELDKKLPDTDLGRFVAQMHIYAKDLATTLAGDAVRLMTMTASKGLTVKATIVAGCETGIVPHPSFDIDEERRLLYVAMTRSEKYLFVTRAKRRGGVSARIGEGHAGEARERCPFLEDGPVRPEEGEVVVDGLTRRSRPQE